MNLEQKKIALIQLRSVLLELNDSQKTQLYNQANWANGWFTEENVDLAIAGIAYYLEEQHLEKWFSKYPSLSENRPAKKVGVVMAGNIPAVGFHDFLSVLVSGHQLYAKLSSQDKAIFSLIYQYLQEISAELANQIHFMERLNTAEVFIATGSDNSARYFEYYFSKKPHIIRRNRNSCAILTGQESQKELKSLGKDIFQYFGLGCRNVSKLYVPKDYDFNIFFEAIENWKYIIHHHKYSNNYDYQKSILLVNKIAHQDNGFLLLREEKATASPISVLHYENYENEKDLDVVISSKANKIQCIVASKNQYQNSVPFGKTQKPELWEYADGIDTMDFLLSL